MVTSVGLGSPSVAFAHLISHARFKARIFLMAGNSIILNNSNQESRTIRAPFSQNNLIIKLMIINSLSLTAIPFTRGFYRKEPIIILSSASLCPSPASLIIIISPATTIIYRIRIVSALQKPQPQTGTTFLLKNRYVGASPAIILTFVATTIGCAINFHIAQNFYFETTGHLFKWVVFMSPIIAYVMVDNYNTSSEKKNLLNNINNLHHLSSRQSKLVVDTSKTLLNLTETS